MQLLVTQAMAQMRTHAHPLLGRLITPRHFCSLAAMVASGVPWAADNDAFNGWSAEAEARYVQMVEAIAGLPNCRFVTCPDVVGEAGLTDLLFEEWAPWLHMHGLPVAYVLQDDGVEYEPRGVIWGAIAAVFVGGSTEYKLGLAAERLVREAKARGKWVHMGRVNTAKRRRYAAAIGCDSIDGTSYVTWRDRYLDAGLAELAARDRMPVQGRFAL